MAKSHKSCMEQEEIIDTFGTYHTSPSLMFLSLKLDIRGLNPQSSITLPLEVAINQLGKVINDNRENARITQELKYKREEPNKFLITI